MNNPPTLLKPVLEEKKDRVNIWIRSLGSLALYLALGYFFFSHKWFFLLIITLIIVIHELGHFTAMKIFNYSELGIFFIPLLGAYVSGTKQEVSQRQSAIILLAGPVPGILIGILLFLWPGSYDITIVQNISLVEIASAFLYLNLLNLIPIYPLDGGQLLHRLFLDDFKLIGRIFIVLSAAVITYFAWKGMNAGYFTHPLFIFPIILLTRLIGEIQHDRVVASIENSGIDLMKSYDELTAEEYWKIRSIVITKYHALKDVDPNNISPQEEQVISTIENLLQRSLFQDLTLAEKFFIIVLWISCFAAPFIFSVPLAFI